MLFKGQERMCFRCKGAHLNLKHFLRFGVIVEDSKVLNIRETFLKTGIELIVYFVSGGCDDSKHLAGFGGGTTSALRLLGVLLLSFRTDPSIGKMSWRIFFIFRFCYQDPPVKKIIRTVQLFVLKLCRFNNQHKESIPKLAAFPCFMEARMISDPWILSLCLWDLAS